MACCCRGRFDGELLERFLGHTAIINDVDLDPTGERLASVSRDFTLKVFDVATGRLRALDSDWPQVAQVGLLLQRHDTVLVGDYWGGLIRVDLESETFRRKVVAANGISSLARSGQHVVASSYDGTIYLVAPRLDRGPRTARYARIAGKNLPAAIDFVLAMSDAAAIQERFVILAAPRSGSNMLCTMLASHPVDSLPSRDFQSQGSSPGLAAARHRFHAGHDRRARARSARSFSSGCGSNRLGFASRRIQADPSAERGRLPAFARRTARWPRLCCGGEIG